MGETVYFEVRQHGATIKDCYRPLRADALRELAKQALEAAAKMERSHAEWLREAIAESETFLETKRAELAKLEASIDYDTLAPVPGGSNREVFQQTKQKTGSGTRDRGR